MVRPKKRRPLILDRTPEARFRARAGRETPALERPHLSARRGVLAMWSLAQHITLQALHHGPYPSLARPKVMALY